MNRKITALYGTVQGLFWMGYAAIIGFASVYLLSKDYTSSQIGMLIAVASLLSALSQPWVAGLADRPGRWNSRALVLMLSIGIAVSAAILIFLPSAVAAVLLLYGICVTLLQCTTSLINALGVTGEVLPNFGVGRAAGSVAYAAAVFVLGRMTDRFGGGAVPPAIFLSFALLLAAVFLYPNSKKTPADPSRPGQESTSGGFFRRYPVFAIVIAGCLLIFISHNLLCSFTYQIIVTRGGGNSEMGTSMAMSAMVELPPMLLFGWMLKKAPCHSWFRISGIFFFLKNLGTLLCGSVAGFYAVQLFQMFGWGLISVSAVYYINSVMEPRDAVKGQSYYTVALTLGNVFGSVIGGRIIDTLGVNAMLAFGTVCAFLGAVILLVFARKPEARR